MQAVSRIVSRTVMLTKVSIGCSCQQKKLTLSFLRVTMRQQKKLTLS